MDTDEKYLEEQQKIMLQALEEQQKLEDDIREFSKKASHELISSNLAQTIVPFRNSSYLLSARTIIKNKLPIVEVRLRNYFAVKFASNPIAVPCKTATAEYEEKELTLENLLEKEICLLMFREYNLIESQDEVGEIE